MTKKFADNATTVKQLKSFVAKFLIERGWHPDSRALAISVAIEAAELLEYFQWDDYTHKSGHRSGTVEELADVIIYCLQLADRENIDITAAVGRKMDHNKRKYPLRMFKKSGVKETKKYYEIKRAYRHKKK